MAQLKVLRIDSEREMDRDVERIEVEVNDSQFTLTATPDVRLNVHAHCDELLVCPGTKNVIELIGNDKD